MGGITFSIRTYIDTIVDIVGIKTGLILTHKEVIDILTESDKTFKVSVTDLDKFIRARSEEFEYQIKSIRVHLGNLSKEMLKPFLVSTKLMKWVEKGMEPIVVIEALAQISSKYPNQIVDPHIVMDEVKQLTDAPEALIEEILLIYSDYRFQSSDITIPERKDWDGGTPLQNIFNCEIKSKNTDFLEQKFLDYIAVNNTVLSNIHWRNFERFCAEFFNRLGYKIELGPGTNDGGIDIRAFDPHDLSKPLILIQCKRYKEGNKVDIETVKSFYTDVLFEKAKLGMIVTTSYIAKGGKKVSEARGYPLSFAENEDVKKWASAMWKYANK